MYIRAKLARCRTIDIVSPILDHGCALHPLLVSLVLEVADPPREKPGEHDGHEEADTDNTDNDNNGSVYVGTCYGSTNEDGRKQEVEN